MEDLWKLPAHALTDGYAAGRFTPQQALASCLARTAHCNPALNAVIALDPEGAMAAAQESTTRWRCGAPLGALDGVPVTVKDNLHVRGLPTHWGSRALAGFVPDRDELPVARLREAGALIFGKTNVPEFAMQGYTDNLVFGTTGNPWQPALTPGGSSGGAVAAVASGCCPLALGTDGGGSIRRPASHTGLVGFKPSPGRLPRGGGLPEIFMRYEVVGPLARCMADAMAMAEVLGQPDPRDPDSRRFARVPLDMPPRPCRVLHVPRFGDHPVDARIAALTGQAAQGLRELGHTVETAQAFELADAANAKWSLLSQAGLAWLVEQGGAQLPFCPPLDAGTFGAATQANASAGAGLRAVQLFDLLMAVERLRSELSMLFARYDLLLTPAAAALPWPAAQSHPPVIEGREVGPRGHAIFTAFANAAGLPAISLPCGEAEGLPVGIQLVAAPAEDALLLAIARQFEQAFPRPPGFPRDGQGR
ncbi:amidase [Cupriavidus sp. UYPR2.512]|uniref:amidase n=1 Tax=Cupriavidus sp. UYPR2.512 TaxID=1080187 RepID=UPI000361F0A9|nr:amidase [Cupriavidus sp. UYPR2.512]UIF90202.1 amidase [Cupriavidus necator]